MCAVCVSCGKCEGKPIPLLVRGTCPVCGTDNGEGAAVCSKCGAALPKPPGGPVAVLDEKPFR